MNTAIEIHDSTVAEIAECDGLVTLHLQPAYIHQSEGRPGIDPGNGLVQEAQLIFSDSSVEGNLPDLPCDVMSGEIVLLGKVHDNIIPIPLEVVGSVELRLSFDSKHTVTIEGKGVSLELFGRPKYVEEFTPPSAG